MSLIPATHEAEAGGLLIGGHPELCSATLYQNKINKRAGDIADYILDPGLNPWYWKKKS
jgi:hypothetical protein